MEDAVKKAIEGGWDPEEMGFEIDCEFCGSANYAKSWEIALLDPKFWQALDKQQKWEAEWKSKSLAAMITPAWLFYWHSFIDHISKEEDMDEFFNSLLK